MFSKYLMSVVLVCVIAVSGCATNQGQKQQSGMVIGGILGGLLGNQVGGHGAGRTAAVIAGTLAGAAIGGAVGQSMDTTDRLNTSATLENVRTGVPSTWRNPDTGNQYTVVPTKTYETNAGPCREYTIDATVGGKREKVYGTACRQSDGSWRIQN
ncbi:MAG: RT0821/Lpp0805 family surface protein [Pseudomonadota bacterium]